MASNIKINEKHIYPCKYKKGEKVFVFAGFYREFKGEIINIEIKQGVNQNITIYLIRNDGLNQEVWQPEDNIKLYKKWIIF